MSRLSIVIPNRSFDPLVEDTLVSVLQNRPEYSEVIVVTSQPYDDPYGLGREVRFLNASAAVNQVERINWGCSQARGDVIHLLLPGTLATDGWTDSIWEQFADEEIGSVAPVLFESENATSALAAGVIYRQRGDQRVVGRGMVPERVRKHPSIVAPAFAAGFYRNEVIQALEGFDPAFGELLAPVELGLALQDLGFRSVVDVHSRMVAKHKIHSAPRTFGEARQAEQLFRRHRQGVGGEAWQHAMLMATEFVTGFPRPRMLTRIAGRLAGRKDPDPRPHYEARLERARAELARPREEVATIAVDFDRRRNQRLRQAA